jgi:hypothetical protein
LSEIRPYAPATDPNTLRLCVLANELLFHGTGTTVGFAIARTESFQTERGMRIALNHVGFIDPSIGRVPGPCAEMFIAEANTESVRLTAA